MRTPILLLVTIAGIAGLRAQGTVNPTILRAPATGAATTAGPAATVAAAQGSVVYVCVEVDGDRGKYVLERPSSGVIVDASGLVLTWRHLVEEVVGATDKTLLVQLNDAANTRLPARIVRLDDATGLALLRVEPPAGGLRAVALGPDRPRTGASVVVMARPEGEEMFAFAGVASPALASVRHRGVTWRPGDVFLTDSRNDERCDGAPVLDGAGRLLGLYGTDNVQRDVPEPTLEDLRRPSFGVVLTAAHLRGAFAREFAAATDASLRQAPAVEPATEGPGPDAVARVADAVVSVWAGDGDWPQLGPKDPGAVQRRDDLGSGVVLTPTGLVVTNRHLVGAGDPRVRTLDGRTFAAEVVAEHAATNLALLQVALPAGAALAAPAFATDADAILGETMFAVGNPLGTALVVSRGVVSAIRGREGGRIQADANLGNANAGGAIVDAAGRVIGLGDGGATDPLEMQFRMRGDRITTETNLSTFVGIGAVRATFADELAERADAAASIRAPAAASAAELAVRRSRLTGLIDQVGGAMLNIYIARNLARPTPEEEAFGIVPEPRLVTLGLGSGVVIDPSGLALSNWHVVDAATNPDGSMHGELVVRANVFGGKTYEVEVLSISRENDLSLLRLVLPPGETLQAVELGNSFDLPIGAEVAAIGNPHGRANTITYGVVSAKGQELKVRGRWAKLEHLIETDAAINGGNSGGALLDMAGRLVGINSAGGGTFNNRGYAIEVDHVRRVLLDLLLSPYKLRSAELGIRVVDEDDGGVVVLAVDDRGPAAAAGVRPGDRVVALAGVDITWSPGFAMTLLEQPAGEPVELVVERDGQRQTLRPVPLPQSVWSVIRQANFRCRTLSARESEATAERVRQASIALYRARTGDADGAPTVTPEFMVEVEQVFPAHSEEPLEIRPGDLVLAFEFRNALNGNAVYEELRDLEQIRDIFNDIEIGKVPDVDHYKVPAEYACWIARDGKVQRVTLRARRLLW